MAFRRRAFPAKRKDGKRSPLERLVIDGLEAARVPYQYEPFKIRYVPTKTKLYLPDVVLENGIVVEVKGYFTSAERSKHLLIKEQYPDLDLRFVFGNPNNRISKKSETTYARWCEYKGFQFAAKTIPMEWAKEQVNERSLALVRAFKERK